MNFSAPFNITIYTDGNKLELSGARNKVYTYTYVNSITKKGLSITLKEDELKKLLETNQIFKNEERK